VTEVLSKIFSLLKKKEKIYIFIFSFLSILSSFLEMLGVAAVIPIVKIIIGDRNFDEMFFLKDILNFFNFNLDQTSLLFFVMFLILSLFILKGTIIFLKEMFVEIFLRNLHKKFCSIIYTSYINTDYQKSVDFKLSEKIRNIGFVGYIVSIIKSTAVIIGDVTLLIFLTLFLLKIDFIITSFALTLIFIISVFIIFFTRKKLISFSKISALNTSASFQNLINVLNSLKEVIVLKRENKFKDQFNETVSKTTLSTKNNNLLRYVPRLIYEVMAVFVLFIILSYFLYTDKNLLDSLDVIGVYVIAIIKLIPAFNKIVSNFQNLNVAYYPALQALNELNFLEETPINEKIKNSTVIKRSLIDKISISNLTFSYFGNKDSILEKINLDIKKGEIVGFYGPSGGGKSTLINLILGFLKPTTGKVITDDFDINKDLKRWHDMITYIPQDIFLLNDSIKKNILFGLNSDDVDKSIFTKVLDVSNLNEFLQKMPEGIETVVGEKAIKLSGGQGQRICIARSLIKDSDIIVLDEATSKLDEKNESIIIEKITKNYKKKCTVIIVSHRYNTLKKYCDKLYEVTNKNIKLDYEK
jgi:ATP-binding cassette, subfamily B, bacterial PglK